MQLSWAWAFDFSAMAALREGGTDPGGGAVQRRGQSWIHFVFCAKQESGVGSNSGVSSLFPGSSYNSLPNLSPSTLVTLPIPRTLLQAQPG